MMNDKHRQRVENLIRKGSSMGYISQHYGLRHDQIREIAAEIGVAPPPPRFHPSGGTDSVHYKNALHPKDHAGAFVFMTMMHRYRLLGGKEVNLDTLRGAWQMKMAELRM